MGPLKRKFPKCSFREKWVSNSRVQNQSMSNIFARTCTFWTPSRPLRSPFPSDSGRLSPSLSVSLSLSLSRSLSSRPSGEQCPLQVFRRPCLFSLVCCSLDAPQGAPSRLLAVQVCRLWRPHRGHQWRHRPPRMCLGWATLRCHLHLTFGLPGVAISVARNGLLRYIINGYVVENHV